MPRHKDIAKALLKEAKVDLNSAKLLLGGGEYSRAISHCQHAVEKALKAALALRGIIITKEHIVSPDFLAAYQDFPEAEDIAIAVSSLEKEGTRTEYPLFGGPDLPIWIPSEHYDKMPKKHWQKQSTCSKQYKTC
jgi:HEPN domain-containing protein